MHSVFISHSWHDKKLARQIASAVRAAGGRVWLDEAEIKLGDSLIEKIREGIDSVDYVIALLSRTSIASKWVQNELDIAMTQQINGRRVKVLPILASRCDLPGFLEGKLHADMSSPKAFRTSLPSLLQRLGAPAEVIRRLRGGPGDWSASEQAVWVVTLEEALSSSDNSMKYKALKAVRWHEAKLLLAYPTALAKVLDAVLPDHPVHIRLRALELVGALEDNGFAYRLEYLLEDTEPRILSAVVDALTRMESRASASIVCRTLGESRSPAVRKACLAFFGKVEIWDTSDTLSLVSALQRLIEASASDRGLATLMATAAARQLGSSQPEAVWSVLRLLLSSEDSATMQAVLATLCDAGELYVVSHKSRTELAQWIRHSAESQEPRVAAQALLAILTLSDSFEELGGRATLWELVGRADRFTILEWLGALGAYRIQRVFDEVGDSAALIAIAQARDDTQIEEQVKDLLAELGDRESLAYLANENFEASGWTKIHIANSALKIDKWPSELADLVRRSVANLPDYTAPEGEAYACLALYAAGAIDITTLLDRFPNECPSWYRVGEASDLTGPLERIQRGASASQRKRIGRLITRINAAASERDA